MKRSSGTTLVVMLAAMLGQGFCPSFVIGQQPYKDLLRQADLRSAQVGISIYDPATSRYLYNYQGDKYFVPASNTKLFTTYAALKWLGDSLAGIRYLVVDTALFIVPTGDPTLLHPDYADQPVIRFLQQAKEKIRLVDNDWQDKPWGRGWAWDDYNEDFMAERSSLPVYGNTIRWFQEMEGQPEEIAGQPQETGGRRGEHQPFETSPSIYSSPEVDWTVRFTPDTTKGNFFVRRERDENLFMITEGKERYKQQDVPFITHGSVSALGFLRDTIGKTIFVTQRLPPAGGLTTLYSRPVDSLLRPMLVNSDNFFAEQSLLMVSDERLGKMNDADIISYLLKNDLAELPQKPVWVDGSGLSRMDLFTPQDFVWLLDKMSRDFGLDRMERLLPTGGMGTLANYYKEDSAYIYAKTGSMSGVFALSGYLLTKKGHLLIFSVLINNYTGGGGVVRREIETLIDSIRDKY